MSIIIHLPFYYQYQKQQKTTDPLFSIHFLLTFAVSTECAAQSEEQWPAVIYGVLFWYKYAFALPEILP